MITAAGRGAWLAASHRRGWDVAWLCSWATPRCGRVPKAGVCRQRRSRWTRSIPIRSSPRTDFDERELENLAELIRAQGLLQPILIRPHPTAPDRYQIVAGERRFRAAMLAGLTEIPSILREADDSDAAVVALVENLQRQDLNAMEEAEGYQRLLQDFGLTHEALGHAVSKSRSHIGNTVRLLRLPDQIKLEVRSGGLSSGHARALVSYPNPEQLIRSGRKTRHVGPADRDVRGQENRRQGSGRRHARPRTDALDAADMERRVSEVLGSGSASPPTGRAAVN